MAQHLRPHRKSHMLQRLLRGSACLASYELLPACGKGAPRACVPGRLNSIQRPDPAAQSAHDKWFAARAGGRGRAGGADLRLLGVGAGAAGL